MPNNRRTTLDELVQLASDFVIEQQGAWDHAAWLDFLSKVERRGIVVSDQMQRYLGELLEAIKRFRTSILSAEGTMLALNKLVSDSSQFITSQQGVWGLSEWTNYCRNVTRSTIYLSDEMTSYLGGILESMKSCYLITPPLVARQEGRESSQPEKDRLNQPQPNRVR